MKTKFLLFCLLTCFLSFSQKEKTIHGKVSFQDTYQKNIDVINFTTRKMTQTNDRGEFLIDAKIDDVLIFMSNNFLDQKYKLTAEDFEKKTILIKLVEKPIPLDEVEITQVKAIRVAGVSYNDAKMTKIEKDAAKPKVENVYTGEMINGVDFIQLGKMVGSLFKRNKPKEMKQEPVAFKEYAKANFKETFLTKTLKVEPADTSRFIDFCDADPNSKTVVAKDDELAILQFLLAKKTEFDKLK